MQNKIKFISFRSKKILKGQYTYKCNNIQTQYIHIQTQNIQKYTNATLSVATQLVVIKKRWQIKNNTRMISVDILLQY